MIIFHIQAWLRELCGKCITTVSGKRERNIYLSRLLLQMQDGKLKGVFQSAPPPNLESPYSIFGLPMEVEDVKVNSALASGTRLGAQLRCKR